MLGAPSHWGAKCASLVVALGLGAAAVIGGAGRRIFGIFAADRATEFVWGTGAVVLFCLSLVPRIGGGRRIGDGRRAARAPDENPERSTSARIARHDETR